MLLRKEREEPPPPSRVAAGVPADLDALCVALLRFDPADRPDARAIRAALAIEPPTSSTSATFTREVPFVGRERELDALKRALGASRRHATVAIVSGESRVGKSWLARRLMRNPSDAAMALRRAPTSGCARAA